MSTTLIYIAPNSGNVHAAQARIYSCTFEGSVNPDGAKTHYRQHPERWAEVGLMNYEGTLVCFEGTAEQRAAILECQPLMAGLVFTFKD